MVNAPALVRSERAGSEEEPAAPPRRLPTLPAFAEICPFAMARLPHGFRHTERPRCCRSSSRHLGQGIFGLWAICARSTFSSGDNPGRRCSRSELGATPQSREGFRELAAWYTNLESSHYYANRPVLSTVTAPGMDRELALLPEEFRRARYAQCCAEV